MMSPREALARLRKGNTEFVASMQRGSTLVDSGRRAELPVGQNPFATILSCSDSRVPPELVFNQGLGDLFVIRVAGNVVAPTLVGSIEFAAAKFDTALIVVMGHTRCGGIMATLEALQQPTEKLSPDLRSIVDRVRPSVEPLLKSELRNDMDSLVRRAVRANVEVSVEHLRHGSELVEQMVQRGELAVVGAEYSLETGVVDFFDTKGAE